MFERYTDRARRVIVLAQEEARDHGDDHITTEHFLLALTHDGESVAAKTLDRLGIDLQHIRRETEKVVGHGRSAPEGQLPFTPRAKEVIKLAFQESGRLGHSYIGTEHLLLALIVEGEGVAARVLTELGAEKDPARGRVLDVLHGRA